MNTLLGHALKPTPYANGGRVSPAMAALRRLKSRREAANYAQQQLDAANEKAGKSSFFGSLGGLAGGVGIPALAGALGFTPVGLPLAILAGLGTAGGAYLGKKKGYGKDVDIDEDMRYGGSEFLGEGGLDRQVTAQDAFTGAFGKDSLISGVKAGLTAGLNKTGGIYGSAGKFGQKLTGAGLPTATTAIASSTPLLNEANQDIVNRALRSDAFQAPTDVTTFADSGAVIPQVNPVDMAREFVPETEQVFQSTLPTSTAIGQENEVLEALKSLQSSKKSLEKSADIQSRLLDYYNSQETNIDPQPVISFKDAFSNARKNNLLEFLYNNNLYSTQLGNN